MAELPQPAPAEPAAPKDQRLPGEGDQTPPATMAATPPPDLGHAAARHDGRHARLRPTRARRPARWPRRRRRIPARPRPAQWPRRLPLTPRHRLPISAAPPATIAATPPADTAPPAVLGAAPAGPQPPTFDIVRVQEDGSLRRRQCAARSSVELLQVATIIGSTTASAEGDFVIVLDTPLAPGDYQLDAALDAAFRDGGRLARNRGAVDPGQAGRPGAGLVEQPGEPSQILTVPEPETPPADGKPAEVASAPDQPTPPAEAAPKVDESANPPAEEPKPDQPKTDQAATPPADAGQPAEAKPAEVASAPAEDTPPPTTATPPAVGSAQG